MEKTVGWKGGTDSLPMKYFYFTDVLSNIIFDSHRNTRITSGMSEWIICCLHICKIIEKIFWRPHTGMHICTVIINLPEIQKLQEHPFAKFKWNCPLRPHHLSPQNLLNCHGNFFPGFCNRFYSFHGFELLKKPCTCSRHSRVTVLGVLAAFLTYPVHLLVSLYDNHKWEFVIKRSWQFWV